MQQANEGRCGIEAKSHDSGSSRGGFSHRYKALGGGWAPGAAGQTNTQTQG